MVGIPISTAHKPLSALWIIDIFVFLGGIIHLGCYHRTGDSRIMVA